MLPPLSAGNECCHCKQFSQADFLVCEMLSLNTARLVRYERLSWWTRGAAPGCPRHLSALFASRWVLFSPASTSENTGRLLFLPRCCHFCRHAVGIVPAALLLFFFFCYRYCSRHPKRAQEDPKRKPRGVQGTPRAPQARQNRTRKDKGTQETTRTRDKKQKEGKESLREDLKTKGEMQGQSPPYHHRLRFTQRRLTSPPPLDHTFSPM